MGADGGGGNATNPFTRASVHVTTSLLDGYLMSLPSERALRYKHDRPAYQLLATTCLLLGMRLVHHDQWKESLQREATDGEEGGEDLRGGGLKRAKTHRAKMNEVSTPHTHAKSAAEAAAIPGASEILRISAAPKSISESDVLSMVREVTGSRSFSRSRLVTALDFVQALGGGPESSTHVGPDGFSLGPVEAEEAARLIDAMLKDAAFVEYRPSIVACASVVISLARSTNVNLGVPILRRRVSLSIFGGEHDPSLQVAVKKAEANLLVLIHARAPSSRNNVRLAAFTTHLIPLEDE